jgi:hypothetical protein
MGGIIIGSVGSIILTVQMNKNALGNRKKKIVQKKGGPASGSPIGLDEEDGGKYE